MTFNINLVLFIVFINFLQLPTIQGDVICVGVGPKNPNNYSSKPNDLSIFDERVDGVSDSCFKRSLPKDCAAATESTQRSGIYRIRIGQQFNESFYVPCDAETENGDWLVIQRRQDGSMDFYRNWSEYEEGFGDIEGEFFIGLKKLYALTNYNGRQELLVLMKDKNGTMAHAKYDSFAIGDASESYELKRIGSYSGTAGNSFHGHVGMKFTTKDRDNDKYEPNNCAVMFTGAWWYNKCHLSNLNGKYNDDTFGKGINWQTFRGHEKSLPYAIMMIRRSRVV